MPYFQLTGVVGEKISQDQCLTIGSWIRNEYTSLLEDFCERQISDDITDTQVENAIRLHEGESLPGFPSPDTFEHLILPHLKKLAPPVMECIGMGQRRQCGQRQGCLCV